jgi:ankyrin repeat protein
MPTPDKIRYHLSKLGYSLDPLDKPLSETCSNELGRFLYNSIVLRNPEQALAIIKTNLANLEFESKKLITPIITAAAYGYGEIVNSLLERGVNINAVDNTGKTALISALRWGKSDIAKILLEHPNININIKDKDGNTALSICEKNPKMSEIADMLRRHTSNSLEKSEEKSEEESEEKKLEGGRRTQRKRKRKCRLVVGKRETCCIKPKKGHWCWSKGTERQISRKMKRNCCR